MNTAKELNIARGISSVEMDENYVEYLQHIFNTCSLVQLEKYHADYESEEVSAEFIFAWEKWISGGNFIR